MLCFYLGVISSVQRSTQQGAQLNQRIEMDSRRLGQDHRCARASVKHPCRQVDPPNASANGVFDTNETLVPMSNRLNSVDTSSEPRMKSITDHQLGIPPILR